MSEMKVDMGSQGTKTIEVDFPSNKKKDKKKERPEKIVKGTVKRKKKPLGEKAAELFIGEEFKNVVNYILYDIIIPEAKKAISDSVSDGIEMLLFGSKRNDKKEVGRSGYRSYTSYSNPSRRETRPISTRNRRRFDDIILESRDDAEHVIDEMLELIDIFGMVSVADLYDLVGISGDYTDNNYGWTTLRTANVRRVRSGYLIELPPPILID